MIERKRTRCLLTPSDIAPTCEGLEVVGVFNPGVLEIDGKVFLLVRVAERVAEKNQSLTAFPYWRPGGKLAIDWVEDDLLTQIDPRVYRIESTGKVRLSYSSHLRLLESPDGWSLSEKPGRFFYPEGPMEIYGLEDPRITSIEGEVWVSYVGVSPNGVCTGLAKWTDFEGLQRIGICFPPENKDVVLFPEKIEGQFVALHRPTGATPFAIPEIWIARSPDLVHWGQHRVLASPSADWESDRIGAGPPPFRIEEGWLQLYHGSNRHDRQEGVGTYTAGALLLDANRPEKVLMRSRNPVLVPERDFEKRGFVPNVVFPTGCVRKGENLWIYYGAADRVIGVTELALSDVLDSLEPV